MKEQKETIGLCFGGTNTTVQAIWMKESSSTHFANFRIWEWAGLTIVLYFQTINFGIKFLLLQMEKDARLVYNFQKIGSVLKDSFSL